LFFYKYKLKDIFFSFLKILQFILFFKKNTLTKGKISYNFLTDLINNNFFDNPIFLKIDILKCKNNAILNENKNGIHINLTELQDSTLINIYNFVEYINTQENKLNDDEHEKQKYKNMFFVNKDN
jgi:hypothetical protein